MTTPPRPIRDAWETISGWFTDPLFSLGSTQITLWLIVLAVALLWALNWVSRRFERLLSARLKTRSSATAVYADSIATIARYGFLVLGSLVVLQNLGINLTSLGALAGALGVGIGFGLKNIVDNFVSGLIILFERPIKVGDRIEIQGMVGDVTQIGSRSTRIRTNDHINIIVPNSTLIQQNVVNWTLTKSLVRFKISITVEFGQDYAKIEQIILDVVREVEEVAAEPPPSMRLMGFGEVGVNLEVRAWSTTLVHRRGLLTSKINIAIYNTLLAQGINLPNPRREIRLLGMNGQRDDEASALPPEARNTRPAGD